jgi:cbb3-type cytochrome oxidase maturation protein
LSVLFILIGISILVAGSFLAAFFWSVKSGQYDDDYTPSVRMLFDDVKATHPPKKNQHTIKSKAKLCR